MNDTYVCVRVRVYVTNCQGHDTAAASVSFCSDKVKGKFVSARVMKAYWKGEGRL